MKRYIIVALLSLLAFGAVTTNTYADWAGCTAQSSPATIVVGVPTNFYYTITNNALSTDNLVWWQVTPPNADWSITGGTSGSANIIPGGTQTIGPLTWTVSSAASSGTFLVQGADNSDGIFAGTCGATTLGALDVGIASAPTPTPSTSSGAFTINSSVQSDIIGLLSSFIFGAFAIIALAVTLVGSYWLTKRLVPILLHWFYRFTQGAGMSKGAKRFKRKHGSKGMKGFREMNGYTWK
jgi:hypothetical protein